MDSGTRWRAPPSLLKALDGEEKAVVTTVVCCGGVTAAERFLSDSLWNSLPGASLLRVASLSFSSRRASRNDSLPRAE